MPIRIAEILKLIVDKEYLSAAERMIKLHRQDIFMNRDRPYKEKVIECVTGRLASNHKHSLRKSSMGYEYPDKAQGVAEEAYLKTIEDCPDVFQTKQSVNLAKQLNGNEP